jgi:cation transport protein ChaC
LTRREYVNDGLSRGDFTEARVQELTAELKAAGMDNFLDRETREAARRETLAAHPHGEDLLVFGYGSLMWNPAVHHAERIPALLHGYHRKFCLWTPLGRGTPEQPGLMLALVPGGRCRGMAIRIAAEMIDSETEILWRREMLSGAYQARWVQVDTGAGHRRAITFVVNRKHPRYGGDIAPDEAVRAIACAEGRLGRCRDYLHNLVVHLDELGFADGPMHRLYARVQAYDG